VIIDCHGHYTTAPIVAETLEPGSSVSIVARRHDVNANQLFLWRRQLMARARSSGNGALWPVEIVPEAGRDRPAENSGSIEIEFGNGARLRVRGAVAPETLRQVIALLRWVGLRHIAFKEYCHLMFKITGFSTSLRVLNMYVTLIFPFPNRPESSE
jgi:transposase